MRRVLVLLALTGCNLGWGDDPYGGLPPRPCVTGTARDPGPWCSVPTLSIVIDGATDDWNGVTEIPLTATCTAPPCDGLLPVAAQIAQQPGTVPWLAIRVRGARSTADARVVLRFEEPPELPGVNEIDTFSLGTGGPTFFRNGVLVTTTDTAYLQAFTPDGFEVAIATPWLPYSGAAIVSAYGDRDGVPVSDPAPSWRACWIPTSVHGFTDPCAP